MTHLRNVRSTLKWLEERDQLITVDAEIDPRFDLSGLVKAMDNGLPLLFRNVLGYPGKYVTAGIFSRLDRLAAMFGAPDTGAGLKQRGIDAANNPFAATVVSEAPCQEIVITEDINVSRDLPITQHTADDPGPILSGGIVLLGGPGESTDIAYKRINFRGPDWASMFHVPGTHSAQIAAEYAAQKKRLPLTINISPPPAVMLVAAGGLIQDLLPLESDELGFAGGFQGAPVTLCQAKTVDAYAIAESEWVIEGYLDTGVIIPESEAAGEAPPLSQPFFPEYHGYLGRAQKTYKFQATAITRRGDHPVYFAPLAHSFESPNMQAMTNRALQWAWLKERWPGLVKDVNSLPGMKGRFGLVVQIDKHSASDDGTMRGVMEDMFQGLGALRIVVLVDTDVDIYQSDEVLWALSTRVNAADDMLELAPTTGPSGLRKEKIGPFAPVTRLGFDATVPFQHRREYDRGAYPAVDPSRWLPQAQIQRVRAMQTDYAALLARIRA